MKRRELFICVILLLASITLVYYIIKYMNSYPILLGFITTLLGSAITFLMSRIHEIVKSHYSQFTGYYKDEIYSNDNPTLVIKRAKFKLVEKGGNILVGDFTRYDSEKNQYTNWKCSGFIVLDQFLLSYRAMEDTIPSRGVIIVKLDTTRSSGISPCYVGNYYKFEGENIVGHKIKLYKISKDEYNALF